MDRNCRDVDFTKPTQLTGRKAMTTKEDQPRDNERQSILARCRAENERLRQINANLLAALKNIVPRFERCCAAAGSDVEYIAEAIAQFRAAIALAEGSTP
jgi:uncharacterized protein YPO0396